MSANAQVAAVHLNPRHDFVKVTQSWITLLEGLGVEGDAHCGRVVQHIYDRRKHPGIPNLRQVHLIQIELIEALRTAGVEIEPGNLGENVSTHGLDVGALRTGARLHIGSEAVVEVTGLRKPCVLIERFQKGLKTRVTERLADGTSALKSGVMAIVSRGGIVRPGDRIIVEHARGRDAPLALV